MKVPIVCKTDGVEAHLCLSLLKHDKMDVGCYQMISVAFKRLWALPRANPLSIGPKIMTHLGPTTWNADENCLD